MNAGVGFGEIALIYNEKRTATIQALEDDCVTYVLDGTVFKTIIIKTSQEKRQKTMVTLDKIKLFGKFLIFFIYFFRLIGSLLKDKSS
jgi:CRP-like cAMP-binding protein